MTARQDFTVHAGRTYGVTIVLTEADRVTRLDLTDCLLEWVASSGQGTVVRMTKSSAVPEEIEVTSATEGEAMIYIQKEDTELIGGLVCDHTLVVTDSRGLEATVLRGLLTITKSQLH